MRLTKKECAFYDKVADGSENRHAIVDVVVRVRDQAGRNGINHGHQGESSPIERFE